MKVISKLQSKHFLIELSPSKKISFICFNDSLLKIKKIAFFHLKSSFHSQDIKILSWLFSHEKRRDYKDKVNFKTHDVTIWLTNNPNTYIVQYLMKERQPDNKVCLVSRI